MDEFSLIRKFFTPPLHRQDVIVGVGDDAAIVQVPPGFELAITTDTLIENLHFPTGAPAEAVGYKALATNLSDLAAMGAKPAWFTVSLTLPSADETWVAGFSKGLFQLAKTHNLQLIGGNLTRGPLSITIEAFGFTPPGNCLLRKGANAGDLIYVSGTLGNAAYALQLMRAKQTLSPLFFNAYYQPTPRIVLGEALLGIASSAIDLSDGLIADLEHLSRASEVSAVLTVEDLPISSELQKAVPEEKAWQLALTGGGDYELIFTVPPHHQAALNTLATFIDHPLTQIGMIVESVEHDVQVMRANGQPFNMAQKGFKHFE